MKLSNALTTTCAVLAFALTVGCSSIETRGVRNTSYVAPSGERVLRHELVVDAPVGEVWRTFTTAEGLRSFLAPLVGLDFRVGGRLETSYARGARLGDPANIASEIVAYVPGEMFVTRIVQTPPGFEHPEVAKRLWTVYEFRPVGERRTRIVVSMAGWQAGAESDAVYRFFDRGNEYTMREVQRIFDKEPKGK